MPNDGQTGRFRGRFACPECGWRMAAHKIHDHTSTCELWIAKYGKPFPYFKAGESRDHFGPDAVEGEDFVACLCCADYGWDLCFKRLIQHLKEVHALSEEDYGKKFPGAKIRLSSTTEARKKTTQELYGVDNVFQASSIKEKIRETLLERYGADHTNQIPQSRAKRAATNLERYGAENPFGSSEIQSQIRSTLSNRYGAENPQQVPEIRARTMETVRERYGEDNFVQTEAFREKFKETCEERYGADHHMKSSQWLETSGYESSFVDPEIWKKAYETSLRNHGGIHHLAHPDVRAKSRLTWLEKYGVDNPSKAQEVKDRIKEVWLGKYGVPFPPQSLWAGREHSFPNKLEVKVDELSPECVVYAGDGSYWVKAKGESKARNPDFVVLKREQLQLYREGEDLNNLRTSAVIEVFGDYWHGPEFTGKARSVHQSEVESYYGCCGLVVLILWENEVKKHPKATAKRIQAFLRKWREGQLKADPNPTVFDFFA